MAELGGDILVASLAVAVDSAAVGAGFIACGMLRSLRLLRR